MRKRLVISFGIICGVFWFDSMCHLKLTIFNCLSLSPFYKSRSYRVAAAHLQSICNTTNSKLWLQFFKVTFPHVYRFFFFVSSYCCCCYDPTQVFLFAINNSQRFLFSVLLLKFSLTDWKWCQQPNSVINNELKWLKGFDLIVWFKLKVFDLKCHWNKTAPTECWFLPLKCWNWR